MRTYQGVKVGALTHQVEVGSKESGIKEDLPGCEGRDTDAPVEVGSKESV
jgi:hypothetical protein